MGTKFYEFSQNNSGGRFHVDEKVCHRIIIEADTEEKAIDKAEDIGCYWNGCQEGMDCDCCGDRWHRWPDDIDLERLNKQGYHVYVYSHYDDPEKRWFDLYGNLRRTEEPKWTTQYKIKQFGTNVFFDTIEQYVQFLANSYGATSPDSRIFYKDGSFKEFFSEGVESMKKK